MLKFTLWAKRVTIEKSIGNSPFKLIYGVDVVFPIQLILPVAKFLQEEQDEENDMVRRMNNLVELQQLREYLVEKSKSHQKKIKETFDRKTKVDNSKLATGFSNGMHLRKRKIIMASLTPYGQVHLRSLKISRTILLFCTLWKEEIFLVAQSMGGS